MALGGIVNKVICLILISIVTQQGFAVDRPPQFVNLAFDGSKSTNMWQKTTEFAKAENIKFTYFISGVYFLTDAHKRNYQAPGYSQGRSAIGFGGTTKAVSARNAWVEFAHQSGHEIASHANGHYDGTRWTYNNWLSEFEQFSSIMNSSPRIYGGANNLNLWSQIFTRHMTGFRAPLLGRNNDMFTALKDKNFQYDTSEVQNINYWPKNINGIWRNPLASLRMAHSNKKTLSMDYNMYVAQSGGKKGNPANYGLWEEEVYQTYLRYFKSNYLGNRAPIDIGHHFSLWNGGIYWKAMKRFAKTVCGLPEVVCGTYTELAQFLNSKTPSTLQAYQNGDFVNANPSNLPATVQRASAYDTNDYFTEAELKEMSYNVCPPEAHLDDGVLDTEISDGVYL